MSEERLKEIKHSIDFQKAVIFNSENDIFLQEELELYNEVIRLKVFEEQYIRLVVESEELYNKTIRLREIIDKAIKYLEEPNRDNFDYSKAYLIELLRGEDK